MKMKLSISGILCFATMTLISKVILPNFFHTQKFFLFSNWEIFSGIPKNRVFDVSWDNGRTFLFRDNWNRLSSPDLARFYGLLHWRSIEGLKKKDLKYVYNICDCDKVEIHTFENDLHKQIFESVHGISKKVGEY